MPKYAWICLNKQDSEYSSRPKYTKILYMAKFWIWQVSQYASDTQRSEYARICLISGSKYASILNMQELHTVLNMPRYSRIWLNWTWIFQNMPWQSYGYILGSTYGSVRNTQE